LGGCSKEELAEYPLPQMNLDNDERILIQSTSTIEKTEMEHIHVTIPRRDSKVKGLKRHNTYAKSTETAGDPTKKESELAVGLELNVSMFSILDTLDPSAPEVDVSKKGIFDRLWGKYSTLTYSDVRTNYRLLKRKSRSLGLNGWFSHALFVYNQFDIFFTKQRNILITNRWIVEFFSFSLEVIISISYLIELQYNRAVPCTLEICKMHRFPIPSWLYINRSMASFVWLTSLFIGTAFINFVNILMSDNLMRGVFSGKHFFDLFTSIPIIILSFIQDGQFICSLN
jgi:hypothetical protein